MSTRAGSGSRTVEAYERLKDEIIGLRRRPGARLVERDLAAELDVSRIPLREALRMLEADGLVVIVPRQGAMVAPFTAADVRHLFDMRESLEVLAARLAARHCESAHLTAAQRQLIAARDALAQDDSQASAAANAAFHECVIEMSGNPLLQTMMQPINTRVRWLFALTTFDHNNEEQCADHEALYEAIAAGDQETAAKLAYEHVTANRADSLAEAARWRVADLDPAEVIRSHRGRQRR